MSFESVDEENARILAEFDRARKRVSNIAGVKGAAEEFMYSKLYDKLASRGVGNRRRLRAKYRY